MAYYDAALIDSTILEDPRVTALSRSTRLLHVEAYVWSRRQRTDGFIPVGSLIRVAPDLDNRDQAAADLVGAGLWTEAQGGWQIAEFLKTQMSRARVEELREQNRERQRRYQEKVRERVRRRVTNGTDGTRPYPTRRVEGKVGRVVTPVEPTRSVPSPEEQRAIANEVIANPNSHEAAVRAAKRARRMLDDDAVVARKSPSGA